MSTKILTLGQWQDAHNKHGRASLDVKIGAYYIYRCTCGSKFFVTETDHVEGRKASGLEK